MPPIVSGEPFSLVRSVSVGLMPPRSPREELPSPENGASPVSARVPLAKDQAGFDPI